MSNKHTKSRLSLFKFFPYFPDSLKAKIENHSVGYETMIERKKKENNNNKVTIYISKPKHFSRDLIRARASSYKAKKGQKVEK